MVVIVIWRYVDMKRAIGLVVKYLVAIEMPRVRFPDGAFLLPPYRILSFFFFFPPPITYACLPCQIYLYKCNKRTQYTVKMHVFLSCRRFQPHSRLWRYHLFGSILYKSKPSENLDPTIQTQGPTHIHAYDNLDNRNADRQLKIGHLWRLPDILSTENHFCILPTDGAIVRPIIFIVYEYWLADGNGPKRVCISTACRCNTNDVSKSYSLVWLHPLKANTYLFSKSGINITHPVQILRLAPDSRIYPIGYTSCSCKRLLFCVEILCLWSIFMSCDFVFRITHLACRRPWWSHLSLIPSTTRE